MLKALATVSGNVMQEKMDKEYDSVKQSEKHKNTNRKQELTSSNEPAQPPKLQDYCPTEIYISMVITYPAEVVKFQIVRPDPEPELDGLQRILINIDDSNFPKIFSERHVRFLDRLKQYKRRATEEQTVQYTKKSKMAITRSATDPLPRED